MARRTYFICTPPPSLTDSIERWTHRQSLFREFAAEDDHARREVRYISQVIEWKLGGEQGPPPEREFTKLLSPAEAHALGKVIAELDE